MKLAAQNHPTVTGIGIYKSVWYPIVYIQRRRRSLRILYIQITWLLFACQSPAITQQEIAWQQSADSSVTISSGASIDTTTIYHHIVDSTTTVTKIINRNLYENRASQRSNSDSHSGMDLNRSDSLNPRLIKTVIKGFAVACICGGFMVLGFFIVVLILFLKVLHN